MRDPIYVGQQQGSETRNRKGNKTLSRKERRWVEDILNQADEIPCRVDENKVARARLLLKAFT